MDYTRLSTNKKQCPYCGCKQITFFQETLGPNIHTDGRTIGGPGLYIYVCEICKDNEGEKKEFYYTGEDVKINKE